MTRGYTTSNRGYLNPVDKHNAKYRKEWDIPEKGIRLSNVLKSSISFGKDRKIVKYLQYVQLYISYLCRNLINLVETKDRLIDPALYPGVGLLCNTPIDLMEIGTDARSKVFEGINKPKSIVKVMVHNTTGTYLSDFDSSRLDKGYRARYRLILLKLREGRRLRDWEKVKRLLLHELSHTMCNHLMYYNKRNHLHDFDCYENILKKVAGYNSIEKQIKQDHGILPPTKTKIA